MNSKNPKTYRAIIVGAGRIASEFDTPSSKAVLTHAHAITKDRRLTLAGIVDIDKRRGEKEAKKWKTKFYPNLDAALDIAPDIVVIATPDETHAALVETVSRTKPKLIICEKPTGNDNKELKKLEEKILPLRVPTLINFSRRFDPSVQEIREALRTRKFGHVISANGIYTNGVLHNGSHMLDLTRFLFGEMVSAKGTFATYDHGRKEPSVGGYATFERCPQFSLMTADEREYAVFELDILTEKKRFRFINFGLDLVTQDAVSDPRYKGFRALSSSRIKKTGLGDAMINLYKHAADVLDGRVSPIIDLADGIKTQRACLQLLNTLPK